MNEVQNNEKNNNTLKIVIIVLLLIIVSILGFILGVKFFDLKETIVNENSNQVNNSEITSLDINSSLISNLVYPFEVNKTSINRILPFNFKVSNLNRNQKMLLTLNNDQIVNDGFVVDDNNEYEYDGEHYYPISYLKSSDMRKMYISLFGVDDTDYKDETISNVYDGLNCPYGIGKSLSYVYDNGKYIAASSCSDAGSTGDVFGMNVYKAEQKGDEIYIYAKAFMYNYNLDTRVYKYYRYNDKNNILLEVKNVNNENDVKLKEAENKLLTGNYDLSIYKYTFKKQSDGKYYVESGEWE